MVFMFILMIIPEKLDIWEFMASIAHLGNLITNIKYIGILARHDFNNVNPALYESSFPLHP
jgi:hypothetical protein